MWHSAVTPHPVGKPIHQASHDLLQHALQAPELASSPDEAGDSVRIALGHALRQLGALGLWRSGESLFALRDQARIAVLTMAKPKPALSVMHLAASTLVHCIGIGILHMNRHR